MFRPTGGSPCPGSVTHTHLQISLLLSHSLSVSASADTLQFDLTERHVKERLTFTSTPLLSYIWCEYYNKSAYLVYFMLMLQDSWKLFADTWLCNEKQSLQTRMIAKTMTFCAFGSMMLICLFKNTSEKCNVLTTPFYD